MNMHRSHLCHRLSSVRHTLDSAVNEGAGGHGIDAHCDQSCVRHHSVGRYGPYRSHIQCCSFGDGRGVEGKHGLYDGRNLYEEGSGYGGELSGARARDVDGMWEVQPDALVSRSRLVLMCCFCVWCEAGRCIRCVFWRMQSDHGLDEMIFGGPRVLMVALSGTQKHWRIQYRMGSRQNRSALVHHKGRRRSLVLPCRLTLSWGQSWSVGLGRETDFGSDSTF